MRTLFAAMLKNFSENVDKDLSRADVQEALKETYSGFKAFKDHAMDEALMTACSNAIIHESKYELDKNGELIIYYACTKDEAAVIDSYLQ